MKIVFYLLLWACTAPLFAQKSTGTKTFSKVHGAITRGDSTQKKIALVFTGHSFADGAPFITRTLDSAGVKASFFFTGHFYQEPQYKNHIQTIKAGGHFLGAHSFAHLLYADWSNRDSLLVTRSQFMHDLQLNYDELKKFGLAKKEAPYFLPPYEWYNDSIAAWTTLAGLQLINMTHGTLSHADYTTPDAPNYRSSQAIYNSILTYEKNNTAGLNGFILLLHIGTDAARTDKFYHYLPQLLYWLQQKGYTPVRIDELLK